MNSAWINITDCCNNTCEWCYAKDSPTNKIMEKSKAFQILDWLTKVGCNKCVLIGGEPTLHPELFSIIKFGEDRGIAMHLVSNGRRFANRFFCEQIASSGLRANRLTFSMYASSSENSRKLTGSSKCFDEFQVGFSNMLKIGIVPNLSITISNPTLPYIDSMIRWAGDAGAKNIIINMGVPTVAQGKIDGSFTLSPTELAREAIRAYKFAVANNLRASVFIRVPFCAMSRDDIEYLRVNNAIQAGCHVQSGSGIVFTVNVEITTCNHLLDFPVYDSLETEILGKTGELSNIWEADPLVHISNSARAYRSRECVDCNYYGICTGGCPIIWSYYNPKKFISGWSQIEEAKYDETD